MTGMNDCPSDTNNQIPPKLLLTVADFTRITCIGRTKFYSEVGAKRIRIVKVGKKTLIPATEPAAWLARISGWEI